MQKSCKEWNAIAIRLALIISSSETYYFLSAISLQLKVELQFKGSVKQVKSKDIAIVVAQVLFIVSGGVKISKEAQGKKCCVCRKRSIKLCGCIK
jgi:hypothetical protein